MSSPEDLQNCVKCDILLCHELSVSSSVIFFVFFRPSFPVLFVCFSSTRNYKSTIKNNASPLNEISVFPRIQTGSVINTIARVKFPWQQPSLTRASARIINRSRRHLKQFRQRNIQQSKRLRRKLTRKWRTTVVSKKTSIVTKRCRPARNPSWLTYVNDKEAVLMLSQAPRPDLMSRSRKRSESLKMGFFSYFPAKESKI